MKLFRSLARGARGSISGARRAINEAPVPETRISDTRSSDTRTSETTASDTAASGTHATVTYASSTNVEGFANGRKSTVSVALAQAISNELSYLRQRLPDVTGTLVATVDGLIIAHEAEGLQTETLAAMSAAQLGLGRQFAMMAAQGSFHEAVVRADYGCLAVFAAAEVALLTVFATADLNLGRLYHEARPVAARIGTLLTPDATSTGPHGSDARR